MAATTAATAGTVEPRTSNRMRCGRRSKTRAKMSRWKALGIAAPRRNALRDLGADRPPEPIEGKRRDAKADREDTRGATKLGEIMGRALEREREPQEKETGRANDRPCHAPERLREAAHLDVAQP